MFILLLQIATTWSKNPLCGGRASASESVERATPNQTLWANPDHSQVV